MGTVLVIDDEKNIADLYKTIIESIGHTCVVAYNGNEALGEIKKVQFNLILLDIAMPEMDGIELIKKIKIEKNQSDAKIVFIIASLPPNHDVNSLKELGAKTVLMKPLKKNEMIKMIAQYIE